ncbi:MAG: haloacid dehalogenase type II [Burkholderiales bacterium]|nr:haloacid dehalogenase type II [Burkholderiales bacterium]MDQ3196843.1 haloacid dehalogenase type II [Pseudomonadota bacterium]
MTIKALVFDAYGTLFDVHSVIALAERIFPGQGQALSQLWRAKQLEYTWLRSLLQRYENFETVTRDALAHSCDALKLNIAPAELQKLTDAYLHLAPYPEARGALQSLSAHRLVILSNGCPAMLNPLVQNAGFSEFFDYVLSVDKLKIYKPDPRVYRMAADTLGLAPTDIGFVSSNFWDVSGAGHFGFRSFWINRSGAIADALGYRPAAILAALTELPAHC